jgi:competence protein ComEC
MSKPFDIPIWKKAPFIRLLLPLVAGILLQWYLQIPLSFCLVGSSCFFVAYLLFYLFPLSVQYKLQWLQAIALNLLLMSAGSFITWQKDIQHSNNWFGNYYRDSDYLVVRIDEPLIEKPKSYKAESYVEAVIRNDSVISSKGKILLYFSKDSLQPTLHYGDKILINKNLQRIKNSGNPGAFNYQRYAAFQSIFHNVFLKEKDWVMLPEKNINSFKQFIFTSRENILSILQKNIPAGKDELGIAEALLIGYTNDLDKDLVQAYSNTGVVHIIAISGMHLALIYVLLVWLFSKMPLIKQSKIVQAILILSSLWLFALLTGGSASVLRSAVMFTFITVGKYISKQSSIYNSLAASAFVMLCNNPYFLWDVGFQLSYLAVVGIIIFQKPVYNWLYIKNKWINEIWKLMAISIAAQVLTFPVCIYYFHQFPNLFLVTNIIAVPLSSLILFAEIGLVAFAWIPLAGIYLGKIIGFMVWLMNWIILRVSELSFAVWDNIASTVATTWLLYAFVIGVSSWLLNKNKNAFRLAISSLFVFTLLKAYGNWQIKNQQKIIVYNVPQHQAIDFINGNDYQFLGDSVLLTDGVLQNFHLKPSRIALQLNNRVDTMATIFHQQLFYQLGNKKIAVVDNTIQFEPLTQKINIDLIIISKNPKLRMTQLASVFNCRQYIFDASNSLWKISQWQKECKDLHLNFHSIPADGAFVFTVGI